MRVASCARRAAARPRTRTSQSRLASKHKVHGAKHVNQRTHGQDPAHRAAHQAAGERQLRRRISLGLQGARDGVRRGAPLPARRRDSHHRLERHGAHEPALRQALCRVARADSDDRRRRQRLGRLWLSAALQAGGGRGAGGCALLCGHQQQRPGGPADLHRPRRALHSPAQGAPPHPAHDPRAAGLRASWGAAPISGWRWTR